MTLTPRARKIIYGILGGLAMLYAVTYLVLAVVAPELAARLLAALPALVGALGASGMGNLLAFAKVDTSTPNGMPRDGN